MWHVYNYIIVSLTALVTDCRTGEGRVGRGGDFYVARGRRGMSTTTLKCRLIVHVLYQAMPQPPSSDVPAVSSPSTATPALTNSPALSESTDSTFASPAEQLADIAPAHDVAVYDSAPASPPASPALQASHVDPSPHVAIYGAVPASTPVYTGTQGSAMAVPANPNTFFQPGAPVAPGAHSSIMSCSHA